MTIFCKYDNAGGPNWKDDLSHKLKKNYISGDIFKLFCSGRLYWLNLQVFLTLLLWSVNCSVALPLKLLFSIALCTFLLCNWKCLHFTHLLNFQENIPIFTHRLRSWSKDRETSRRCQDPRRRRCTRKRSHTWSPRTRGHQPPLTSERRSHPWRDPSSRPPSSRFRRRRPCCSWGPRKLSWPALWAAPWWEPYWSRCVSSPLFS